MNDVSSYCPCGADAGRHCLPLDTWLDQDSEGRYVLRNEAGWSASVDGLDDCGMLALAWKHAAPVAGLTIVDEDEDEA